MAVPATVKSNSSGSPGILFPFSSIAAIILLYRAAKALDSAVGFLPHSSAPNSDPIRDSLATPLTAVKTLLAS